jgi:hypothetical protein
MLKQLTDDQIRDVINSLRQRGLKPTGLAVRSNLRSLYGMPGGVERIYRLIGEAKSTARSAQQHNSDEIALLKQQLAAAVERAELAEHRERTHQERWVMEIDLLRQQLRSAQIDARKLSDAQNQLLELRRELHRVTNGS